MHVINSRRVRAVAMGFLLVALATAGLASASPDKPYSVVLTDNVAASGLTVTATFVNETAHQRLGSADLTAPAGYAMSSATASEGSATVVGNVVELRNLGLMPGQSVTVTIKLSSSTCSTHEWTVIAKQANNFSGPPGNNLTLDTANSNLNTAVCGVPCKEGATCITDAGNSNGDAQVTALKADNAGELLESVNPSDLTPLTCQNPDGSDYQSADRNTYGVFATVHRKKVVKMTIANPAVSIPLKQQQVCFDAPYKFRTARNSPLLPDGKGGYVGLLPPCGADSDSVVRPAGTKTSVGPCHDRDDDKMMGSTVVLVVNIPSGLPQDPHMS
jgi:predicted component of type VI protein secretion system